MKKFPNCPYCGAKSIIRPSIHVYRKEYGSNVLVCSNYPKCNAFVGCHKGTKNPLGRLADKELREAKIAAHAHFDPIWKTGKMKRKKAYKWLAKRLGIHPEDCHIGFFDESQCDAVIEICLLGGHE